MQIRVIKKYPNRRLYDTFESSYMVLSDLQAIVMRGEPIKVIDQRTRGDITEQVLLQVIDSIVRQQPGFLSTDVLTALIQRAETVDVADLQRNFLDAIRTAASRDPGYTHEPTAS